MKLNYFYKCEADQFTFYRLPKILVVNEMFSHISYGSKILYGLLLDRMGLSLSNHWHDEFGRAYDIPANVPDSYTHFMRCINSMSEYTFKFKVQAEKANSIQLTKIEKLDRNIEEIMKLALSFI